MNNKSIKQTIKKLRLSKKLSQSEMAKMMNISQTSYNKLEKGDTSLISHRIYQISQVLGIPVQDIIIGSNNEEELNSKLNDLKQKMIKENNLKSKELKDLIYEKEETIENLKETIRDKNEIIGLLRDKISSSIK
ncbi:MAG: helix-turn-helix transcriptional regulator [Bacteroidales bacterium]